LHGLALAMLEPRAIETATVMAVEPVWVRIVLIAPHFLETINRTPGLCFLQTHPFQQSWLLVLQLQVAICTVPYMRIPHRIIEGRAFRAMLLNHSAVETWGWTQSYSGLDTGFQSPSATVP
jgi:hypothetical protein